MKKFLILSVLGMMLASSLQAQDWLQQLVDLNEEVLDSIICLPKSEGASDEFSAYMLHYHQPLQHDEPELGDLPLRALLIVRPNKDCTNQMMQVTIGGYGLDSTIISMPDLYAENAFESDGVGEFFGRYDGNLLMPEHRYFNESCPEKPWTTLGYCEAKEAAADFHALFEAMKKVFTDKWVITGGSKGGITTAMQHAFYPDDADCYVAYVAPFLHYSHDTRMQDYYMEHGLTPELNERLLSIQREMLKRPSLHYLYYLTDPYRPDTIDDAYKATYMFNVAQIDINKRAYWTREQIEDALNYNDTILATYYDNQYTDEMLLYFMSTDSLLLGNHFVKWYQENFGSSEEGATRGGVFGIDEELWNMNPFVSYHYQAVHELGTYDYKWDYFFTDQQDIDDANELWHSLYDNVMECMYGDEFQEVVFNPELLDFVRQQTAQAKKPILFIYGGDDAWTGAHMEEEYINGENVQLYILPEQNHSACINSVKDKDLQAKLWAFTDAVFAPWVTGITQIGENNASNARSYDLQGRKMSGIGKGLMIRDGRVTFEK